MHEAERVAFTPLVFAATGGAGKLTTAFLERLAVLMAEKSGKASLLHHNDLVESATCFQSAAIGHSLPQKLAPKGVV